MRITRIYFYKVLESKLKRGLECFLRAVKGLKLGKGIQSVLI